MHLRSSLLLLAGVLLAPALAAQEPVQPPVDSIVVEGNQRLTAAQIIGTAGIVAHQPVNYRDIQRALAALFRTGQFDDVVAEQRDDQGRLVLVLRVRERPILERWAVRGVEKLSERTVKERVKLVDGRPVDRAAVARGVAAIDSTYRAQGYFEARATALELPQPSGKIRIVFDVKEGNRVAISQVVVEGNHQFSAKALVGHMESKPEGFWWFQRGQFDERKLEADTRERLPAWYSEKGFVDFQVLHDSLDVDSTTGKAQLRLTVDEGQRYMVGKFDISGNRRFSTSELTTFYPFGLDPNGVARSGTTPFDRADWEAASEKVRNLYSNNGYIYANVEPEETRRTLPNGTPVIDLRWNIHEGSPATINKIEIVGNDVTHERVIRDAIVLLPGDLFSRERLIRSYQNIANLGFFQQPLPPPDVKPTSNNVDVDITFRVEEKRTGNINFGASLGQGTGLGGFLGLEEPNLFGRGKRGRLQWQFGKNINDFTLSYTDPAIQESRTSGTISVFNSQQRFTVGDLGRRRQIGFALQFGWPFLGSRYTRLFTSYGLQVIRYTDGSAALQQQFRCYNCTRSSVGVSVVRDTRIDLPFATAGSQSSFTSEFNGGILGGTGNYQKLEYEGRYYAPLGTLGGGGQLGSGVRLVLGLTAKSGFIFGDTGPFYTELYSMGGTQYGVPLRGYEEFSITPNGYDPTATGSSAAGPGSFGKAYASFTLEAGARLSQALYFNTFLDAGNVYRSARQYDPTRLFRGAGFGVAIVSPLGPIGLDLGYGFDRVDLLGRPKPGWKLHFRLGNFF